jgi:helix-turn-helix, Psq domain
MLNVVYQHTTHISMQRTFTEFTTLSLQHAFSFSTMLVQTQEAWIIMAMEAIQTSKRKLSCRKAAGIYNVPEPTLRAWIAGRPSRSDYRPKAQNLTKLEENIIV